MAQWEYCFVYAAVIELIFVIDGRSTSTAQALWLAERLFRADSREGVNRVLLLVTDGWSTVPGPIFGVLWPAARLKHNLGITTQTVHKISEIGRAHV